MKAIHGGKAKNDRIDSLKIAGLLRSGMFPIAYVYPPEMRATRDLLRRRTYLVRRRAEIQDELPTLKLETKTGLTASSSIRAVLGVIHVTGEK